MSNYIENGLVDIRKMLDILLTYKENIVSKKKFKTFDYRPNDLKVFKMVLVSTLFTENFDDISGNVDNELKRSILNNCKIRRMNNSPFSFENGGYFKIGVGINIKRLPPTFQKNDYTKILKMIRNGIAHSKYTYDNGIVKISTYNGQFEADCDVDWLEMMVLCLFSNRLSTTKMGARNVEVDLFYSENGLLNDFHAMEGYISVIENGSDARTLLYNKMVAKKNWTNKLMENGMGVFFKEDCEEFIKNLYINFDMEVVKIEKINNIKDIVLGIQNEDRYKEATLDKKYNFLGSRIYAYYDEERKNTMAYKNIVNLLDILRGSMDKQNNKISKVGTDFFVDYMSEYCFKCYVNLVYNYINEKNNFIIDNVDNTKFDINIMDSRTLEAHIRNACCHNRVKITGEDLYLFDKNNGVINFELKCKVNDFIELTDDLINKMNKQGNINVDINNLWINNKR